MDSAYYRVPMEEFNKALWDRYHNGKIRNVYPLMKYNDILEKIKAMEANPPCNSPGEYYLLRKFKVVNINGKERLSCKPDGNSENTLNDLNNPTKYYVALEEIYSVLDDAHKFIKHGCRDRLVRRMQGQGIVNITRETTDLFLSFCKPCRPRRNTRSMKSPLRNSLPDNEETEHETANDRAVRSSPDSNCMGNGNPPQTLCTFTRGFVDCLDFSSTPDGDYRHVFIYIDIQTCFCVASPIRCKCVTEMTSHLLDTFTLLGPPQVLHSNFSSPFLHSLIEELKQTFPEIILVSGSQNYSELQEVAQNCVSEVGCMLKLWMLENNTRNWSRGVKLIQLQKNTKLSTSGSKSPYECFFRHSFNCNLPPASELPGLKSAFKEDQLLSLINEQTSSEPYEHLQVSLDPNICKLVHTQNQSSIQPLESISPDLVVKEEPSSPKPETNGPELRGSSADVKSLPKENAEITTYLDGDGFYSLQGGVLIKEVEDCETSTPEQGASSKKRKLDSTDQKFPIIKEGFIHDALRDNYNGTVAKLEYSNFGFLSPHNQQLVAECVLLHEIKGDIEKKITAARFTELASGIEEYFPSESASTYYIPFHKDRDNKKHSASGKLVDLLYNIRRKAARGGIRRKATAPHI